VTGGLTTPTGSVELKAGSTVIGTGNLVAGSATITVPKTLAAGSHTLTAVYVGSTVLMASHSAGAAFKVTKAKATVTAKLAKKSVATTAKAKVAVTVKTAGSVATGKVTIKDGSKVVATGRLAHGKVVVTLPKLKPGKHKLTVVYTGSPNVAAGTSKKIVLTVKK
jgi:Bacterial Ig-like domain (group 3)